MAKTLNSRADTFLTMLSSLSIHERRVQTACGEVVSSYTRPVITLEGPAGTGKSSLISQFPYFLVPVDGDRELPVDVCVMNVRMLGEPPIGITEVGSYQAAKPLEWESIVRVKKAVAEGKFGVLALEELYALPDHLASMLLYSLAGDAEMNRVAIVALTNPQDYYAVPLTLYPNLAQRFGYPVKGFDSDPMVHKVYDWYLGGRFEPIRIPAVIVMEGEPLRYWSDIRMLISYALEESGDVFDQRTEEGKWVSPRTMDWAAYQLLACREILLMNDVSVWDAGTARAVQEWMSSGDLVPPSSVTNEILRARLGPAASAKVMGVLSGLKPFPIKEFLKLCVSKVPVDELRNKLVDLIENYVKASPVQRVAEMQIVWSISGLMRGFASRLTQEYGTERYRAELGRLVSVVSPTLKALGEVVLKCKHSQSIGIFLNAFMDGIYQHIFGRDPKVAESFVKALDSVASQVWQKLKIGVGLGSSEDQNQNQNS
jgi:hypothetical protein